MSYNQFHRDLIGLLLPKKYADFHTIAYEIVTYDVGTSYTFEY